MSQELYENVIKAIREDLQDVGGDLQRGASDDEIEHLQESTERQLGSTLPAPYVEFLKVTDGLSWGGVAIYGTTASPIVGFPGRLVSAFIESNLALRDSSVLFENYLVIGSEADSVLAYNIRDCCYEVFTVFITPLKRFNEFAEMVCDTLKSQL